MPERKSMRRIKECLRLHFEAGLSQRAISRSLQIARSTVQDYLQRAERSKKSWTDLKDLADEQIEALLFPSSDRIAIAEYAIPTGSRCIKSYTRNRT